MEQISPENLGCVSPSTLQSLSLLHTSSVNQGLDVETMSLSPFYALHTLYAFAAASESQFLNMVHINLDEEYTHFSDAPYLEQSLANLKYQKEILNDHIQQLQANVQEIERRGCATWPLPDDSGKLAIAEKATAVLLEDYVNLLKRAERLSRECAEGMEDVRNSAILAESRKAFDQARGVRRLTLLGYFFLPFSFTTSFFGMNFKELKAGVPEDMLELWVWFAVSLPLFGMALLVCYWGELWRISAQVRDRKHRTGITPSQHSRKRPTKLID
jgi:CorA-like Mg2+ transporter protein